MGSKILEMLDFSLVAEPSDENGSGATGDYVKLSDLEELLVLVLLGDGTASHDLTLTLYQATNADGGSAKILNALETGRIYTKLGSGLATAIAADWTKETQATADEVWTDDDSGEQAGITALVILPTDLDTANGFDWVRCDITDPTAAKVMAATYVGLRKTRGPIELAPGLDA